MSLTRKPIYAQRRVVTASLGFGKILIPLKHRVDLVEAYEYNRSPIYGHLYHS